MRIKTLLSVLLTFGALNLALGAVPRFLLVPSQLFMSPNGSVECDLYLYNDSKKTMTVPSFETISKVYDLQDVHGVRLPRGASTTQITSHLPREHSLRSGGVEHAKITIEIPAEAGDVVEVYVEIGSDTVLRSNAILLLCRVEEKPSRAVASPTPTSAPK